MRQGKLQNAVRRVRGKRDWVKNALIIFLAALLVLTFFSNTIMNWSLPEVAAQYPRSTTITTKIRGSGTVAAARTYNVTVEESRTVASVSVKAGDAVKAGDTLLTLDESESQELTDARAALAALQLEYQKMQLDPGDQTHADAAALQQARDAVSKAESDLAEAQQYEADLGWYQDQVANAKTTLSARTADKEAAQSTVDSLTSRATEDAVKSANSEYLDAANQVASLQEQGADSSTSPRYSDYRAAVDERDRIYREQVAPALASLTQQLDTARKNLGNATTAEAEASNALTTAQDALERFQTNHSGATSVSSAETTLQSARDALSSLEAANADKAAQKAAEEAAGKLDLSAKEAEVKAAEDKVGALEQKAAAAKIVSRYAGVVQTVNVAAGDKTSADTPLMVVELTEQGYTLTASVTKEQARPLKEGMTAEITNLWDSGITMTLAAIQTDKSNPASARTLTFLVQGENVEVGQTLNFSIGDKNASYDVVVPSAAVHADADGSFVYTVAVKSSPLGNRYTVKKTKVEVLASDEVNSAISGEVSTADFVITTATVPLQPGDQVRIAE